MVKFWLLLSFIFVRAKEEIFNEANHNCYNFNFFEKQEDISLLHCGMKCLMRHQCQCLSFSKTNKECRVHGFPASDCSITSSNDTVTLQKHDVGCAFETDAKSMLRNNVDLSYECGKDYLMSPIAFDLKQDGSEAGIAFDESIEHSHIWKMFIINLDFSSKSITLSQKSSSFEREKQLKIRDMYTFWLTYDWQKNGDFKFQMGEGESVGNNTIFNESSGIELAYVKRIEVFTPGGGKMLWKFHS